MLHSVFGSIVHGSVVIMVLSITDIRVQIPLKFRRALIDLHSRKLIPVVEVLFEFRRRATHRVKNQIRTRNNQSFCPKTKTLPNHL